MMTIITVIIFIAIGYFFFKAIEGLMFMWLSHKLLNAIKGEIESMELLFENTKKEKPKLYIVANGGKDG